MLICTHVLILYAGTHRPFLLALVKIVTLSAPEMQSYSMFGQISKSDFSLFLSGFMLITHTHTQLDVLWG